MVEVNDEESDVFWGSELDVPSQPFNSLRRRQLLVELKEKFKLDPIDWRFVLGSYQGHHDQRIADSDRIEDAVGSIVNRNTGERIPVIYDWTCDCDGIWNHERPDPAGCNYIFFWELFGDRWFRFSPVSHAVVETKL